MQAVITSSEELRIIGASIEVPSSTERKEAMKQHSENQLAHSDTKRSSRTVVTRRYILQDRSIISHTKRYSNTSDITPTVEQIIQTAKLKPAEAQRLRAISSLRDLQRIVGHQEADHRDAGKTTAGGRFQGALVKIHEFGKTYDTVLNSLKEAVPHGGGHVVWVLLGGLFIVAEKKNNHEKAISKVSSATPSNA
jgi:hypothetical protein